MAVIMSEFVVLEGSELISMKLEDMVEKYHVEILHYLNNELSTITRKQYKPEVIIERDFYLKVTGSERDIRNLRIDSVKYR